MPAGEVSPSSGAESAAAKKKKKKKKIKTEPADDEQQQAQGDPSAQGAWPTSPHCTVRVVIGIRNMLKRAPPLVACWAKDPPTAV